jgi:Spy/CpxP family protein refolding chaperone
MRQLYKGIALLLLATTAAEAQDGRGGRGRRGVGPRDSVRTAIERRIRAQVQPTDEQMIKLRQIDNRFELRRTTLNREEMTVRRDLRQALMDTANVNQPRIGQLLDRMVAFPGRRAALMEEEQKALAEVLTPLQRAKYHAIQEQLRRLIEQGRGGPPQGRGGPPPPAGRSPQ